MRDSDVVLHCDSYRPERMLTILCVKRLEPRCGLLVNRYMPLRLWSVTCPPFPSYPTVVQVIVLHAVEQEHSPFEFNSKTGEAAQSFGLCACKLQRRVPTKDVGPISECQVLFSRTGRLAGTAAVAAFDLHSTRLQLPSSTTTSVALPLRAAALDMPYRQRFHPQPSFAGAVQSFEKWQMTSSSNPGIDSPRDWTGPHTLLRCNGGIQLLQLHCRYAIRSTSI